MKITRIEPTVAVLKPKKRVAAYARVSMESDRLNHSLSAQISCYGSFRGKVSRKLIAYTLDSDSSYAAQVDYYTNYIKSRADWEFAGMYSG